MNQQLDEAAGWFARLHAPDCTQEQKQAFAVWLQDPKNRQAYELTEQLSRSLAADPRLQALADAERTSVPMRAKRRWVPLALAASVLFTAGALLLGITQNQHGIEQHWTAGGELKNIVLNDGSTAYLDVDTQFSVAFTPAGRQITLLQGRAIFDVTHDRDRPFSVIAGNHTVTALGTRFQVEHLHGAMSVVLEEGVVEVVGVAAGTHQRERLRPGDHLSVAANSGERWQVQTGDIEKLTSWSRGRHSFRDEYLLSAVQEVNRYVDIKVRLGDPSLGDKKISGNFVLGDSRQIVAAWAASMALRVVDTGRELVLFPIYDAHHNGLSD